MTSKVESSKTQEQLQADLNTIEKILKNQLEVLENAIPKLLKEEIPPEGPSFENNPLLRKSSQILSVLNRHTQAEDVLLKEISKLKNDINEQHFYIEEIEMERDVLLQQIHTHLETNSSLRVRLEEQRCQSGTLQKQLNADLESRIKLLERDKEKLNDLNTEKDNELHKMNLVLEQTTKCLRNKEEELMARKTEENQLISLLKSDFKKVLEEKTLLEGRYASLKERVEDYFGKNMEGFLKRKCSLRRSRSMCELNKEKLMLEKNIMLEPAESIPRKDLGIRKRFKNTSVAEPNPDLLPKCWMSSDPQFQPNTAQPIHTQLKALKRDLLNVTKKFESLKCQLVSSGVIEEEPNRSLKRKAKPVEELDKSPTEEQKSEFKNLKNILQDAKNLNNKLENLRDEKQKIIDLNKRESVLQVAEKDEPRKRSFQKAVMKLKKAVRDCEEKLEGGVITEDEAFAGLVSPFYACILSNPRCFHEWRRRTGSEFNDETDTDSLMEDGSTEVSSPGEDGGGDNLLKKQISNRGFDCRECSKSQTSHLKCKIEPVQET